MSTLMSTDLNVTRPTTRVRQSPGGATTISFGDPSTTTNVPPPPPAAAAAAAAAAAPEPEEEDVIKHLSALSVENSSSPVAIAIATWIGADAITLSVAKALAAVGIRNVFVEFVESPLILPFVVQKLVNNFSVVISIAVITADTLYLKESLSKQILEIGFKGANPVVTGAIQPTSLLELKALLAIQAPIWASSASSLLALKTTTPTPVSDIISAKVLDEAAAPPTVITVDTNDAETLLGNFRESVIEHGARGICGLARLFKIADEDHSGDVSLSEFTVVVAQHGISWTAAQTKVVFDHFDHDKSGSLTYDEFLVGIRGDLNDRRKQLVLQAFGILDKNKSGIVDLDDIKGVYDGTKHPDVIAGKRTEEDVLREFLETFEPGPVKDGKVTPDEFINYYKNISASIDDDDYFELMIRNAWHISGGEGWSANSSCRRVLATHADGRQSVEEIKNDLGIKAGDKAALLKNLKDQGINDIVSIDLKGSTEAEVQAGSGSGAAAPPSPAKQGVAAGGRVGAAASRSEVPRPSTAASSTNPKRAVGGATSIFLG